MEERSHGWTMLLETCERVTLLTGLKTVLQGRRLSQEAALILRLSFYSRALTLLVVLGWLLGEFRTLR